MIIKYQLLFYLVLFFISCNSEIKNVNNYSERIHEDISNKELFTVLETENISYIKKVLNGYEYNINEVINGYTILDEFYYNYPKIDKKIVDLLLSKGAKTYSQVLISKIKKSCIKSCEEGLNLYIYNNSNLTFETFIEIIENDYDFLEFILKKGYNPNKQIFKKSLYSYEKTVNDNGLLLDSVLQLNKIKVVKLLEKYGAKRLCKLNKKKCNKIVFKKKCIRSVKYRFSHNNEDQRKGDK